MQKMHVPTLRELSFWLCCVLAAGERQLKQNEIKKIRPLMLHSLYLSIQKHHTGGEIRINENNIKIRLEFISQGFFSIKS